MDHQHLSQRLALVANKVAQDAILADIGSDHAYLPAYLVLNNKIKSAIAGEVVKGPFNSAKHLVEELELNDKISVRFGDGLDVLKADDAVTCITICGMGGALIRDILDRGIKNNKLSGKEQLILQPNIGEKGLRTYLNKNGYTIISEAILEENKKFYEIIVAEKRPSNQELNEEELLFGPFLLRESHPVFIKKWQQELKQRHYVLNQLEQSSQNQTDKIDQYKRDILLIEEVLTSD